MFVTKIASLLALAAVPALAKPCTTTSASPIPIPTPTYLFTARLAVGPPIGDPIQPIPLLQGGSLLINPILNGTINGPAFNGTFLGGHVAATDAANNTVTGEGTAIRIPSIYVYGQSEEGLPFYVEENGVGPVPGQNTLLKISVGGPYSGLQSTFILAQPSTNAERTEVTVLCYELPLAEGIA